MRWLNALLNSFSSSKEPKTNAPKEEPHPFKNQEETLKRYDRYVNENGDPVGMCQSMTNVYAKLRLQGEDTGQYLGDDRKFLQASIDEENEELDAELQGDEDTIHHAFNKQQVPHEHVKMPVREFSKEKLETMLKDSEHFIISYPTNQTLNTHQSKPDTLPDKKISHAVYFGKLEKHLDDCVTFDANHGEQKAPCGELIRMFVEKVRNEASDGDIQIGMAKV
ncbi:hypothetical protein [Legionella londiniensis]|uniref:Uncharacterized protein n=1 Tax=Legionella londiniensis TaxID=45068 RepID=A0A0W0VS51_9GAMM|nr:hypothetical protein [Legionella londiniensis]KTD22633.1 hypothetical protein Llon_0507 [Legionella londiniensis]STX92563.1 Uncharacterised protein [Legionella londiniensis]